MTEYSHLEALRQLHEQDWEKIGKELVAFAEGLALRKSWRGGGTNHLALGLAAEDIAQEAIKRAFEGTRRWDPEKSELLPWLKQVVASLMYHFCTSSGHRRETATPESEDGEDLTSLVAYKKADLNQAFSTQYLAPEEMLLTEEEIQHREEILLEVMAGDQELEEIFNAVTSGCEYRPRHLAQELQVPVEQVYNRIRRLKRRVAKLMMRKEE